MYKIRITIGSLLLLTIGGLAYLDHYTKSYYATSSVMILLILAALWELLKIFENIEFKPFMKFAVTSSLISFILILLRPSLQILQQKSVVEIFEVLILLSFFLLPIFRKDRYEIVKDLLITITGIIYTYYFLKYLVKIRLIGNNFDGIIYLVTIILIAKSMDIGGYLIGKAFGKHKLCPQISPKKSWEGFVGGVVLTISVAILMLNSFQLLQKHFTLVTMVIFAIFIGLLSLLGDLSESMLKRICNVKDSNSLIPEFGGILDLVDSLIFVAPFAYFFLNYLIIN